MAYRFEGKQKLFSIGVYPAVSLADARQLRDEARRLLAQGIAPNAKKQAEAKRHFDEVNTLKEHLLDTTLILNIKYIPLKFSDI